MRGLSLVIALYRAGGVDAASETGIAGHTDAKSAFRGLQIRTRRVPDGSPCRRWLAAWFSSDGEHMTQMQTSTELRPLEVRRLGLVPYGEGLAIQDDLVRRRRAGEIPDTLLLLEHTHVITLGSGAHDENVLVGPEERAARGIELYPTGRGGDVTYHGPGQLVGYPILDLKPDRQDLHRYLRDLEEMLIGVLGEFGLRGGRKEGLTGVWVDDRKVAAIGVRVGSGWITSHGFALNVSTDLSFFGAIVPCGIRGHGVGSISQELGRPVAMADVEAAVVRQMERVFGARAFVG
jgi:lipoyl(octanoyl) transferase